MSQETIVDKQDNGSPRVFRFPPFTFAARAGLLCWGDDETQLPPKAAQVLEVLLARPGQLVTKEELLESVWQEASVTESSLTSAIKTLRNALGDDARDPLYIQTLHRRGYRFIGTLEEPAEEAVGATSAGTSDAVGQDRASIESVAEEDRGAVMRIAAVAVLALVAAVVWLVWPRTTDNLAAPTDETETAPAFNLVVLPVPVAGTTVEQQLFAGGLGNELAGKLATIMSGVVPEWVASNFDLTDKTYDEIVAHFDASFILELSVRWSTEPEMSYRIDVNLRRAADAVPIWTYRGEPGVLDATRMLDEQERLASDVVAHLGITVPLGDQQPMVAWPTGNLQAWEQYLLGMEKMRAGIYAEENGWEDAAVHFESALKIDPDYAVAKAMLARTYAILLGTDRLGLAKNLVAELERDHPDLPQTQWALGSYYYNVTRVPAAAPEPIDPEHPDLVSYYERALHHLEAARRGLPYALDVEDMLATVHRRLGNWDESTATLERLRRLQPQNTQLTTNLMLNYLVTRQHEATDRLLDELIAAKPSNWHLYPMKAFNYVGWGKPTSSLHAVLGAAPAPALAPESFGGDGTTCQVLFAWILVDAAEGAWTRMINRLAAAPDCRGGSMGNMGFSLDLYAALALRKLGRDADAAGAVEAAVQRYQSAAERRPQRYSPNASLGLAYAVQGDREAALHYAEHAVSLLPIEQDAFQGIEPYYFYVRTLAQVGEIDRALEGVEQLLSIPSWLTIENIRADPFLEPIVADGRFEELADKYGRRDRSE